MHAQLKQPVSERLFSNVGAEFADGAIAWPGNPGRQLVPDATKAYCRFEICYAWPVRTAYGASFHPGTLANSRDTMLHQVFNRGHKMKSYAKKEDRENTRDENFGSIVGVEYNAAPPGGWRINSPGNPHYEAAAVIHKQVSFVPKLLGEHLGGQHKWAVSQEVLYLMQESGFIIEPKDKPSKGVRALMDQYTPDEFKAAGLAYIPVMVGEDQLCPDELMACFSFEQRRVVKDWEGQRVSVCKGGINGQVHFQGVGMVRYGAEKEAQIQSLMANDPDAVESEADFSVTYDPLKKILESSRKMLTEMASAVLPRS